MSGGPGDSKLCAVCGRTMTWRRKWANNWTEVRYCSDACRRRGTTPVDDALAAAIIDLLSQRKRGASICPSEAAREVDAGNWRALLEPSRAAARRLVAEGRLEILQNGRVVDPSTARGPIRLRLRDR